MDKKNLVIILAGVLAFGLMTYDHLYLEKREVATNPDPNHSHADFAVWVGGKQPFDFSKPQFQSGHDAAAGQHDEYFHVHDGNGKVLHRHKPGLPLEEFFLSVHLDMDPNCKDSAAYPNPPCMFPKGSGTPRMFVNGKEIPYNPGYVFVDLDHILLTDAATDEEVQKELSLLTDDACMYSKTCPERGEPPTEGCVADPEVPCTE
jgi:hypothetical protein